MPNPDEGTQNNEPTPGTGDGGQDFEALYKQAQAELEKARQDADHWKDMSRKNEERAKANYGAAKDLEGANSQIADLNTRLEAIESENKDLKASAARATLNKKVSEATGVPEAIVSMLAADDETALTEAAKAIAGAYKTKGGAPKTPEGGKFPKGKPKDDDTEAREFVRALFGSSNN